MVSFVGMNEYDMDIWLPGWKEYFEQTCGIGEPDSTLYAKLFKENEISLSDLELVTDDFLQRLGINKGGHRLKIIRERPLSDYVITDAGR
jgi:hypothetical protein